MCLLIFLQLLSETFLILEIIQRDIVANLKSLHVRHPLFLSDFNKTWIFPTHFQKISNIKLHQDLSSGSRVVSCGLTDMT